MTDSAEKLSFDFDAEAVCVTKTGSDSAMRSTPSATGSTVKKGSGRPSSGYRSRDGKKIPSVTTVLGRFKESGALLHWAWKCGLDGIDYRQKRDTAADIGTLVHEVALEMYSLGVSKEECERYIWSKQESGATPEERAESLEAALHSFGEFVHWRRAVGPDFVCVEVPLVSEQYRYAGTLDAVVRIDGELWYCDVKTSKGGPYPDHALQCAAYMQLWEETQGERFRGCGILSLPKEKSGRYKWTPWLAHELEPAREMFLCLRKAYGLDGAVNRLMPKRR